MRSGDGVAPGGGSKPAAAGKARPPKAAWSNATWAILALKVVALLYPAVLLAAVLVFRGIGEQWWVVTIALYLPRLAFAAPMPFVLLALWGFGLRRWLWTQLASLLLLLFPLMGLTLPRPRHLDQNAPALRILSYNINSSEGGADAIVNQIEKYSPDIVLLQEVGRAEDLERLLAPSYPAMSVAGQFLLASRYPILSTNDPDKVSYEGRLRSPRFRRHVIDTPLGRLVVYNVHPVSPRDDFTALRGHGLRHELLSGRFFSGDSAPLIDANAGLRAAQVQAFASEGQAEPDPVVIAGDTNLPGLSKVFADSLSLYQDGFQKAGWGFGYTYPNDRRPPPWMRIDRILATDQLRFVRFDVGDSRASDHRCVVAELQKVGWSAK